MEFGRILMVHFVNQFLEASFGFWCRLEREQQMVEGQAVRDGAAIVSGAQGCRGRVSGQGDQLRLVNRAGDYRLGTIGISRTLGGTLGESGGEKCGETNDRTQEKNESRATHTQNLRKRGRISGSSTGKGEPPYEQSRNGSRFWRIRSRRKTIAGGGFGRPHVILLKHLSC